MIVAVFTFAVMLTAVAAMALGVMFTGRRLQGSCGGVGGADCICDREGRPRECEKSSSNGEPPLAQLPTSKSSASSSVAD